MADLECAWVVAVGQGETEVHESLEIDGAMSAGKAVQGTPELPLQRRRRRRYEIHLTSYIQTVYRTFIQ